jgi:hypothetical protein
MSRAPWPGFAASTSRVQHGKRMGSAMNYLASGGVPMAAVLITSILMVLTTIRSWRALRRARWSLEEHALLETAIDSILFWGFFAAILGALGTLGGLAEMARFVETTDTAGFWGAVHVAISTSVVGTAVFVGAVPTWYLIRRRWQGLHPT